MNLLQKGQFYGQTNETIHLDGITMTDTEYTHEKVDWHYHENAYFTFIIQGNVIEGNKKEVYNCGPGTLLFHNWQEPHYNIKPKGYTRGFHIELEGKWNEGFDFDLSNLQGNMHLINPDIKLLIHKIFKETKINDVASALSIQSLLIQTLSDMQDSHSILAKVKPNWVQKIKEILHEESIENFSLKDLSTTLGIHPVHLSRDFSKHFNCSISEYTRKIKVEKSMSLLSNKKKPLVEISYECGFSDQSHFNRCFKEITGLNPLAYRKIILS